MGENKYFEEVLELLDDGVLICTISENGCIINNFNKKFSEIFNYEKEALIGKSIDRVEELVPFVADFQNMESESKLNEIFIDELNRFFQIKINFLADNQVLYILKDTTDKHNMLLEQEYLEKVNMEILRATDIRQMLKNVLELMLDIFDCERAWLLFPCDPEAHYYEVPIMNTRRNYFAPEGLTLPIDDYSSYIMSRALEKMYPVDFYSSKEPGLPQTIVDDFMVKSQLIMAIRPNIGKNWVLGVHKCLYEKNWTHKDKSLFAKIAERITEGLNSLLYFRELQHREENLRITLMSIGDAVISTDRKGKIMEMNYIAENLTGWNLQDAKGLDLQKIFNIVNANTLEPCEDPVEKVLKTGQIIGLANHTVLISKNGERRQIADSGAPIKDANGDIIGVVLVFRDVTHEYEMQERIVQNEKHFRTIFDNVKDAIILQDINDGKIIDANKSMLKMYGYESKEEVIGLNLNSGISSSANIYTREMAGKLIKKAAEGEAQVFEWHSQKKDGTFFWTEVSLNKVYIENEYRILAVVRDVTERKKAENALVESEERYRVLFEKSTDPIVILDDEAFIDCNNSTIEFLKYKDKSDFIGKTPWDISPHYQPDGKDSHSKAIEMIEKAKMQGYNNFEWVHLTSENEEVWLSISITFIKEHGKLYYYTVWRDITAQKKSELALKESEEKFRGLAETTSTAILLYQDNKWIYANPAALKLSGFSLEELKQQNFWDFVTDEFKEKVKKLGETRQQGKNAASGYEFKVKNKYNQEAWVFIQGCSTMYNGKPAGMISVIDITEKKRSEEELLKMHKLESLGTLAGGIAHDFNNILTGIYGNISLAKLSIEQEEKAYKYLDKAENSLNRARNLTKQLLTFSKGGAPVKEYIDISDLVKEVVAFDLSGSAINPIFDLKENLWMTFADKGQINQVVSNLIINSRQAMPSGGNIYISMENYLCNEVYDEDEINPGAYLKLSIKDEGVGISEKYIDKIFDPYFTTKQTGSGLGMAMVYSIVKKHEGFIQVKSEIGKGTVVDIFLPAEKDIENISLDEENGYDLSLSDISVLIMDDELEVRQVLRGMLEKMGAKVVESENGEDALEKYNARYKCSEPFDFVIMDLTIPGAMGGKDAIKYVLELNPDATVFVSSGYSNNPVISDFKKYGFRGYYTYSFR